MSGPPWSRWCCACGALIGATILLLALRQAPVVEAAPHVISDKAHPFDPDWLLVKTLLDQKCSGCHRPRGERWDFSSYEAVLSAGGDDLRAIVPGDLSQSLLWDYVQWNAAASDQPTTAPDTPIMPPTRHAWLTAQQQETLRRWIEHGAMQYRVPHGAAPLLETDFPSAKQCQQCHPRQYAQWAQSMHAYAQHSPVFEAFNLTLIERTSGTIGTFCTRCHTPLGTALGENGSRRNVHRSRLSMEGVTCVACHRRPAGAYKSSGRVFVQPGDVGTSCMYGPFESAISMEVGAHKSQSLPYIRSSQFCGECHDVTSPQGVRLEEAFSEWNHSPAAREGQTCQSCHMGPVPGRPCPEERRPLGRAAEVPGVDPSKLPLRRLSDHTFAGPDYSLLPDTEFPEKLDWMYEVDYRDLARLTPWQRSTLDELRRRNRASLADYAAKRAQLLSNAGYLTLTAPAEASRGAWIAPRADVTSTTAGHSLPTGFTAERQVWVSVELRDQQGRLHFVSGDPDSNGDLRDEHSHAVLTSAEPFDHHLLNFQNKFIALGIKGTERSVVIAVNRNLAPLSIIRPADALSASFGRPAAFRIARGSLPPLRTQGRAYPMRLPDAPGSYRLTVRLQFRHLPPTLLDHIGAPHLKKQLEAFAIDQEEVLINVR